MPDIYAYTDYRRFLKDYYTEQKARTGGFSYQAFADAAGFQTKTFIRKIIIGDKALSSTSIARVARACKLKKKEREFFDCLVRFNEGKNLTDREYYFRRLQRFKYTHHQVRLRANQFQYYSRWYYPIVRELVTFCDFQENYHTLSRSIVPRLTPGQARSAVKFLLTMGMIARQSDGTYKQTDKNITTGDHIISTAVQRYHKECIRLGGEAIERFPSRVRDISTITVGISQQTFEKVKHDIQCYRKHIIEMVNQDTIRDTDRIYQLNIQFFPVTPLPDNGNRQRGTS